MLLLIYTPLSTILRYVFIAFFSHLFYEIIILVKAQSSYSNVDRLRLNLLKSLLNQEKILKF